MTQHNEKAAVLFVDDDEGIMEAYKKVLVKSNNSNLQIIKARYKARNREKCLTDALPYTPPVEFVPLFASSGEEAINLVKQENKKGHQIVAGFFDICMPKMDGLETIKQIKKLEPDMLCALVTAYTDNPISNIRRIFKRQDEWIYFNKPFTKGELDQAIVNLVSSWNNRQFQRKLLTGLQENNDFLIRIANEMNSKKDLNQTLDFVIKIIKQLTNSRRISVLLLDDAKQYLSIKKAFGIDEEIVHSVKIKVGEPIAGEVFKRGKLLVVDDISKLGNRKLYSDFKSFVSIPLVMIGLKTPDNPLGIINITNKDANEKYTEEDLKLLTFIANYASIAINNQLNALKLEQACINTVESLAIAIEAKYPHVKGHSKRVAEYSINMARELDVPAAKITSIKYAAILHDIGKITIDSDIIKKPGSLTEAEFAEIKKHSVVGEFIIKKVKFLKGTIKIVRHHHERYDGNGYPDGIKADKIELGARILAVADAYDAMLSTRPYREALSQEHAITELKKCSGTQFDPQCVTALLKVLDIKEISPAS